MSTEKKKKSKIYKSNVIQFPDVQKNQALDEHERSVTLLASTVELKMDQSNWDKMILIDDEIKMLSNYGETLKFAPTTAARLISVLATTLIRNNLMEDIY